jgi:hypothetical protein
MNSSMFLDRPARFLGHPFGPEVERPSFDPTCLRDRLAGQPLGCPAVGTLLKLDLDPVRVHLAVIVLATILERCPRQPSCLLRRGRISSPGALHQPIDRVEGNPAFPPDEGQSVP